MDNILTEMHCMLGWIYKRAVRPDFTLVSSYYSLSSQIHIMFSFSYFFKGNFDGVNFNKAQLPPEQQSDSWFPLSTEQSATAYFIIWAYNIQVVQVAHWY